MRSAVTGASGGIGTYVCDQCATAGHDVVSIDRVPPAAATGLVPACDIVVLAPAASRPRRQHDACQRNHHEPVW